MPTILDRIVEVKRLELERHVAQTPLPSLEARIRDLPVPLNLSGALMGDGPRLIAECKKASPSRGLLREDYDPAALATAYAENGAAAISVLTERDHFQGGLEHMQAVKDATGPWRLPVLRKDFLFDPYQVYEARANGADAVLLIAAILSPAQLGEMLSVCRSLWVQALTEVHTEDEMDAAIEAGAEIIGINNRDLRTFTTDITLTERLAIRAPRGRILVSESGIHSREDVVRLGRAGVHAVLVGEALVTAPDPGAAARALLGG